MENSKKIIERIKEKHIEPIPKWYFSGKNALIWGGFILSMLLGAAAFAIILFAVQQTDFSIVSHLSHSRLELILGLLPVFWLLALITFLTLGIYSIYHSKRGYKFQWTALAGANTLLSILLGTLFFITGGAGKLEKAFSIRVGLYESIQEKKLKLWMKPEEGFLAGTVISVQDSMMLIADFNNQQWSIDLHGAFIAPVLSLEKEEKIKMLGKIIQANQFQADEVRPWGGPEQHSRRKKQ